jgi:hypothetical protein
MKTVLVCICLYLHVYVCINQYIYIYMPVLCVSTYWYRHNWHLQMIGLQDVCPFFQVDAVHWHLQVGHGHPGVTEHAAARPMMVTAAQDIRATAWAAASRASDWQSACQST